MAPTAVAVPKLATSPGFLFWAPLGTAEPTNTVVGSVFTDAWAAGWIPLGATEEGSNFSFSTSADPIEVAEFLDPIAYVETGRTGSIAFALASVTMMNLKRSLNGGTVTTTGSTTTTMSTYTPPRLGQSVRAMIGWESQDSTERLICRQTFNGGTVEISRRKGADKATIPYEASLEVPASGDPFIYVTAGETRLGV